MNYVTNLVFLFAFGNLAYALNNSECAGVARFKANVVFFLDAYHPRSAPQKHAETLLMPCLSTETTTVP
jgi:hypothetical protein